MTVYRPRPTDGFEWVIVVDRDDAERLLTLGPEPLAASWEPIVVRRLLEDEGERFQPADLPWLGGHVLVMKARARDVLAPVFGEDVELLPIVSRDGVEMWVTHALRMEPVLDLGASELKRFPSSGRIMEIVRHEFTPAVDDAGVAFKLEAEPRGALYVTEPVVAAAAAAGLTGARFEMIWSR